MIEFMYSDYMFPDYWTIKTPLIAVKYLFEPDLFKRGFPSFTLHR